MGVVYQAEAPDGRPVAIKVIHAAVSAGPDFRYHFRRNVLAASRVTSRTTVKVVDADPDADRPWVAFEYVAGPSLLQVVGRAIPSLPAALGIVSEIAEALVAVHEVGVILGDLRPSNILCPPAGTKVTGLGIAVAMPPGRDFTSADDVLAWGCSALYALTGRLAVDGDKGDRSAVVDLSGVPPELTGPISASLARRPDDRPTARMIHEMMLAIRRPKPDTNVAAVSTDLPSPLAIPPRPVVPIGLGALGWQIPLAAATTPLPPQSAALASSAPAPLASSAPAPLASAVPEAPIAVALPTAGTALPAGEPLAPLTPMSSSPAEPDQSTTSTSEPSSIPATTTSGHEEPAKKSRLPWAIGIPIGVVALAAVVALVTLIVPNSSNAKVVVGPKPLPSTTTTSPEVTGSSSDTTLPGGIAPLASLLPGDVSAATGCTRNMSPPSGLIGLINALICSPRNLPEGQLFAFQFDNEADYSTSLVALNKFKGFDPSTAGSVCPPGPGVQGLIGWHSDVFPVEPDQVLECLSVGTADSQPDYVWTYPTDNAFIDAQAAEHSTFADLGGWWAQDTPPKR